MAQKPEGKWLEQIDEKCSRKKAQKAQKSFPSCAGV
jgi:hypothetical protein